MESRHIGTLEKQIKETQSSLKALAGDNDLEELFKIIHWPGWTTPAEIAFASGILEAINAQVRTTMELKSVLMKGSREVSAKQQETAKQSA